MKFLCSKTKETPTTAVECVESILYRQPKNRKAQRPAKGNRYIDDRFLICAGDVRRGGRTPACGFAHARNDRGCRQIKAVKTAVHCEGEY